MISKYIRYFWKIVKKKPQFLIRTARNEKNLRKKYNEI